MDGECEKWADLLFEPEEALSDLDASELANHLACCSYCARERELFIRSWLALDEVQEDIEVEIKPNPMLRAQVWEQIRQEKIKRCSITRAYGRYLKTATAAIIILAGFSLGKYMQTSVMGSNSNQQANTPSCEPTLDPDLINLASQDGFSLELFPESPSQGGLHKQRKRNSGNRHPISDQDQWPSLNLRSPSSIRYVSQPSELSPPRPRESDAR